MNRGPNFWLLQVNPKKWDIEGYLAEGNDIKFWSIVNNKSNIMPMDQFVLWRTGFEGGVIGWGSFTGSKVLSQNVDRRFWNTEISSRVEFFAVDMDFVSLEVSFSREYMKTLSSFGNSIVFRSPQSANAIRLTRNEWQDFDALRRTRITTIHSSQENEIILEISEDLRIPETTRLALVESRLGQGQFRKMVLLNEPICRVTGTSNSDFLIASHIKPWRNCNNDERLDANNGLMLAPHVDRLFDRGWISFSDDGDLLTSEALSQEIVSLWFLPVGKNVGRFNLSQKSFLAFHREHILIK